MAELVDARDLKSLRGPVITWASRSTARIASSLLAARIARTLLARAPIVRIAVHPGDAHVPILLRSIDETLASFRRSHTPARYAELLPSDQNKLRDQLGWHRADAVLPSTLIDGTICRTIQQAAPSSTADRRQ